MKIVRDGKEFELTDKELFFASLEYKKLCAEYDFENCLYPDDYGVTKEEFDSMREDIIGLYVYFWKHHDDELTTLLEEAAREIVRNRRKVNG